VAPAALERLGRAELLTQALMTSVASGMASGGGQTQYSTLEQRTLRGVGGAERNGQAEVVYAPAMETRPTAARLWSRLNDGAGLVRSDDGDRFLIGLLQSRAKLAPAARLFERSNASVLHELQMQPFEQRRLELEVEAPSNSQEGEMLVYRLAQMADGLLLGGYTVVVRVGEERGYR
jgi:hypothetical protein